MRSLPRNHIRDEAVLASLEQKARQWANEHEFREALL